MLRTRLAEVLGRQRLISAVSNRESPSISAGFFIFAPLRHLSCPPRTAGSTDSSPPCAPQPQNKSNPHNLLTLHGFAVFLPSSCISGPELAIFETHEHSETRNMPTLCDDTNPTWHIRSAERRGFPKCSLLNFGHQALRLIFGLALCAALLSWSNTAYAQCTEGEFVAQGCGNISFEGCCDGATVTWCETETDTICRHTCDTSGAASGTGICVGRCGTYYSDGACGCDPECVEWGDCCPGVCGDCPQTGIEGCGAEVCSWKSEASFYGCTSGPQIADPSGLNPLSCNDTATGCTPQCFGKTCGDDGCGGSCGSCAGNQSCNVFGQCVANCSPDCSFKVCGDDGCGGSCGNCPGNQTCNFFGQCVSECTPNCGSKQCGDDGCGGSCGSCFGTQSCNGAGQCVVNCTPNCALKQCGNDGCGGTCGTCNHGETCNPSNQCVSICIPNCTFKDCGDDGCGGSCGACGVGSSCEAGQCLDACTPDCTFKECGDDGCGGVCGSCNAGQACNAGKCMDSCIPDCSQQECGADGCGGSCGYCGAGNECLQGQCVEPSGNTSGPSTGAWQDPCPLGQVELYGDCVIPSPPPAGAGGPFADAGCTMGKSGAPLGFWLLSSLFSCVWFLLRNEA